MHGGGREGGYLFFRGGEWGRALGTLNLEKGKRGNRLCTHGGTARGASHLDIWMGARKSQVLLPWGVAMPSPGLGNTITGYGGGVRNGSGESPAGGSAGCFAHRFISKVLKHFALGKL